MDFVQSPTNKPLETKAKHLVDESGSWKLDVLEAALNPNIVVK